LKVIGHVKPYQIPEYVKTILKIKEDTLLFNIPLSFCKENKINPENLEFEIIKNADKIMLIGPRIAQDPITEKPTQAKAEASTIG